MPKRQSAFNKALLEAQNRDTVKPLDSETVTQLNGERVEPSNSIAVKQSKSETVERSDSETARPSNRDTVKSGLEKTSFYIPHTQLDKLDDLAHECKKRTGERINRNDIVRALIDQADLQSVLAAIRQELK